MNAYLCKEIAYPSGEFAVGGAWQVDPSLSVGAWQVDPRTSSYRSCRGVVVKPCVEGIVDDERREMIMSDVFCGAVCLRVESEQGFQIERSNQNVRDDKGSV